MASTVERTIQGAQVGVGGQGAVAPLSGMEGIIKTNAAVAQTLKELADQLKVINERGGTMGFGPSNSREVASAVGAAVAEAIQGRAPAGPSGGKSARISATGVVEAPPIQHAQPPPPPLGHGYSLGALRQNFGEFVQQRLGNATWGPQLVQNQQGQWIDPSGVNPIQASARSQGLELPWIPEGMPASPEQVEAFHQRESSMMALRGGAAVLARGGTFTEAGAGALAGTTAGAMALRGVAIGTTVLTAADAVADWGVRQRAENARWQSIMGGSNLSGFGERFQQNLFGLSQFGRMGAAEAERLYRGVAETGLQGYDRTRAQAFGTQNYMSMGMSIDQSLQVIEVAARTGQESLLGVANALERVTASAAEAGINTERARESFIRTWTSFSETLGGQAGLSAALGVTGAITGLGREFQGVSGEIGANQLYMQAAQLHGMDLNQYLLAGRDQPDLFVQDWQTLLQQQVMRQMSPQSRTQLQRFQRIAGQREFTEAEREQLSRMVLTGGINVQAAMQIAQQFGVQGLTMANAPEFFGQVLAGNFDPAAEAEAARQESATRYLGGSREAWMAAYEEGRTSHRPSQTTKNIYGEYEELKKRVQATDQGFFAFSDADVRVRYLGDVLKTGRVGGISEALATNASVRQGVTKVRVMTPEGEKVVDLAEAMQKYRDQIDAGTAVVVEGEMEGATIAEALGMAGDESLATGGTRGGGTTQISGSVTFSATPELMRLIRPSSVTGPVTFDEAWSQANPHTTPGTRATGDS